MLEGTPRPENSLSTGFSRPGPYPRGEADSSEGSVTCQDRFQAPRQVDSRPFLSDAALLLAESSFP